jgi:hypothetical protein
MMTAVNGSASTVTWLPMNEIDWPIQNRRKPGSRSTPIRLGTAESSRIVDVATDR